MHLNFGLIAPARFQVPGPEKEHAWELMRRGVPVGMGQPALDGYHAWVKVKDLLDSSELMAECRDPLLSFLSMQEDAEQRSDPVPGLCTRSQVAGRQASQASQPSSDSAPGLRTRSQGNSLLGVASTHLE